MLFACRDGGREPLRALHLLVRLRPSRELRACSGAPRQAVMF